MCLLGALAGAIFLREPAALPLEVEDVEWSLRDRRLWRLCAVSGLYVVAQMAILSFVVLYLHDERGLGKGEAAAVLGAVQVAAIVLRIGAGRWSDMLRSRTVPLARIGVAMSVSLAVATALLYAPLVLLVPAFVVAGSLTMAWNGVAFAAVAELAGRARSGAALSVQQTVLSARGRRRSPRLCGRRHRRLVEPRLRARGRVPDRRLAGAAHDAGAGEGATRFCAIVRSTDEDPRAPRAAGRTRRPDRLLARGGRGARAGGRAGFARPGSRWRSTPAGNLIGRIPGGGRQVWTGSHLDTVPGAGRFDGTLGVVAGLEAVEALGLPGLAVVVFRDEERGCAGSRACVAAGTVPDAYVELHIEQGPTLLRADAPLGVVTAIVGYVRGRRSFTGTAGHAGTTPMDGREDALVAAAEFVLQARDVARGIEGAVATVGRLSVEPGGTNVIPGFVGLTVDARAPDARAARPPHRGARGSRRRSAPSRRRCPRRSAPRSAPSWSASACPCSSSRPAPATTPASSRPPACRRGCSSSAA